MGELSNDGGNKFDGEKLRVDLLPPIGITSIADILTFGAKKYADNNWKKGIKFSRVYGALQRHLLAWYGGEEFDHESGLPHLWHAACNLMFLTYYMNHYGKYVSFDDRGEMQ